MIKGHSSSFEEGLSKLEILQPDFIAVKKQLHQKIVGMEHFINGIFLNILCNGHMLVEGAPGLAKTKTISTFAELLGLDFQRIQFTPDMLPSDITGVEIYHQQDNKFVTQLGPIVANIILADEINRTTPKVQSALLESMQEQQVTIGGETHKLPHPFMVLATQNPIEQEGTYPLPEAQLDRFLFKVIVEYPSLEEEKEVLDISEKEESIKTKKSMTHKKLLSLQEKVKQVYINDEVKDYITRLVEETRKPHQHIQYGASPRGSLGLLQAAKAVALLEDRDFVSYEDVQRVYLPVMRHRIILSYEAMAHDIKPDNILLDLATKVGF